MERRRAILKTVAVWLFVIITFFLIYQFLISVSNQQEIAVNYSDVVKMVKQNKVEKVLIQGREIVGQTKDGKIFKVHVPEDSKLIEILENSEVEISSQPATNYSWLSLLIWIIIPLIFFIVFFGWFRKNLMGGMKQQQMFSKSKAKLLSKSAEKVTFEDVAGIDEAVVEVEELVDFLNNAKKYTDIGAKIPRGVLLIGPPGTGKTLLAKATAGVAKVPFFYLSGSDFVEMFVGVGASRVRDLFEEGKKNAPCILFVDELDGLGRQRGAGLGGGHDEREQTLNQFLVEMDGMNENNGVVVIAATNRPDVLDPALLRPGRFTRQIVVDRPDVAGREAILRVHVRTRNIDDSVDLSKIARMVPGFTGADIENLVNEAVIFAVRNKRETAIEEDFIQAKDKVMLGVARPSAKISDEQKRQTAYHEAGHAIVALLNPNADEVEKLTVIPRGLSGGATAFIPDESKVKTDSYLTTWIEIAMGGRIAEEVFLKIRTTGAQSDIEQATKVARDMVTVYGMSEKIGPVSFGKKESHPFLGRELASKSDDSEETKREIETEIKKIVQDAEQRAKEALKSNQEAVKELSMLLFKQETVSGDEAKEILVKHLRRQGEIIPEHLQN